MADLPHRRNQSAADRLAAADERDASASARDAAARHAQDEMLTMGISERVIREAGRPGREARTAG